MKLAKMRTPQVKCVVGIAATALVAVPIGYAQVPATQRVSASALPATNPAAPVATPPHAGNQPMSHLYELTPGDVLQRFPPPFPPQRLQFYRNNASQTQVKAIPSGPDAMLFRPQMKPAAAIWGMKFGSPYTLGEMLQYTLGVSSQDIEGDRKLVAMKLPGDFVMAENATDQRYLDALANIASKVSDNGPITVSSRQVDRPIIVLRGTWNYHPVSPRDASRMLIELYGQDLNSDMTRGGGGMGDSKAFADWVSDYIKKPVVIEAQGMPSRLHWHLNSDGDGSAAGRQAAHDSKLVLQHLQEQTGLTAADETRAVRRVFVEQEGL